MKKRMITIEWKIVDTRDANGSFYTGTSTLITTSKDAINDAINFANNIPACEIERNSIDLEQYREFPNCSYYYMTMISRIIKVEVVD